MSSYTETILVERNLVKNMYTKRDYIVGNIVNDPQILCYRFLKRLRKCEASYNKYKSSSNIITKYLYAVLWIIRRRWKNRVGNRLSIDVHENCLGRGCQIFHPNIVINGHVIIGENCRLHGHNCIGNDGKTKGCPVIGDNVDIGNGAMILGDIKICSNVTIGGGAVVVKSISEPGTYVGVPARRIGNG